MRLVHEGVVGAANAGRDNEHYQGESMSSRPLSTAGTRVAPCGHPTVDD
jgi:hypothetical protein